MSSTTSTPTGTAVATDAVSWRGGLVAGLAGSAAMGALISLMNPPTLAAAIAGLYGLAPPPNGVAGWVAHMSHGAIFGVIFAGVLSAPQLRGATDSLPTSLGIGLAYGIAIWVVAAALLMPVWLRAVGFPSPPPFPNFAVPSLLWHAVFGAVLGAAFPFLADL
jgi:hypothetical protein